MCFSNLPVEFDENGDPYLADDADDVTRPGDDPGCGCCTDDVALDDAPEDAYEAILSVVSESTRADLRTSTDQMRDVDATHRRERDTADGD